MLSRAVRLSAGLGGRVPRAFGETWSSVSPVFCALHVRPPALRWAPTCGGPVAQGEGVRMARTVWDGGPAGRLAGLRGASFE
jgi:hypothetical protein